MNRSTERKKIEILQIYIRFCENDRIAIICSCYALVQANISSIMKPRQPHTRLSDYCATKIIVITIRCVVFHFKINFLLFNYGVFGKMGGWKGGNFSDNKHIIDEKRIEQWCRNWASNIIYLPHQKQTQWCFPHAF